MMKPILSCFTLLLVLATNIAFGRVVLPSIFSDNMVLQQRDSVLIWGKAALNKTVVITNSWNGKVYRVRANGHGHWKTRISTPKAGGPYTISFDDGEKLVLKNILIGEVWICSGQSNMEMPLKGFGNQPILNSNDILFEADNQNIRLIRYERGLSRSPEYEGKSTSWEVSSAQSAREFSAVGYQYAQLLQRKLSVPVGMIMSTWGGTKIEAWMNAQSLESFSDIKIPGIADTAKIGKNDPTVLFNAMINPFLGYGIRGVIWYQGEQNRGNPQVYDKLMIAMVNEWRSLWKKDFPFYYVQIAPFRYKDTIGPANLLREAQLKASTQIPNSGMVVTMDVGAENFIHPPDKTTISKRLAWMAMAKTYGMKGIACESPVYNSMTVDKDMAKISFDHADNGFTSFGKNISGFEIAGEDRKFYPANARISGKLVIVKSEQVKNPVAVRYAFGDWVEGTLFNTEGLPASPFRTDNW